MSTPPKVPPDIFIGPERRRRRGHDFKTPDEINKEQQDKVDKKFTIKPTVPKPSDPTKKTNIT